MLAAALRADLAQPFLFRSSNHGTRSAKSCRPEGFFIDFALVAISVAERGSFVALKDPRETCGERAGVRDASALTVMTVVAGIFLPVVLAYTAWSYYVFRRRLSDKDFRVQHPAH
jgi:hypothetical protein